MPELTKFSALTISGNTISALVIFNFLDVKSLFKTVISTIDPTSPFSKLTASSIDRVLIDILFICVINSFCFNPAL